MTQQITLVIKEITLMIKKAINSGEICCKSEVADQTIAPNEVIRHTIQKNAPVFCSIGTSYQPKKRISIIIPTVMMDASVANMATNT